MKRRQKKCLKTQLQQTISEQMIADVPLGAFLSGGVDSSLICALAQEQSNQPINTFTIGFDDKHYNEAPHAKAVANHLKTNHHEWYLTAQDCLDVVEKLPQIYSEPFADSSQIPTYLVAKMTKQQVSVVLSGDGGDELFCGYNRYQFVPQVWQRIKHLSPRQRCVLKKVLTRLPAKHWNRLAGLVNQPNLGDKIAKLAGVLESSSYADLYENVISLWQEAESIVLYSRDSRFRGNDSVDGGVNDGGIGYNNEQNIQSLSSFPRKRESHLINSVEQMMRSDQQHYLPDDILTKVDRATMAVSLESRAPFLDHRVVELSHRIPLSLHLKNNQSKYLLRHILYDYVPKHLIERPKMGFGVPIEHWLRGDLRDWAESLLQPDSLSDYFHPEPILKKWNEHLSGKFNWQYQLWTVLMFQAWRRSQ